MHAPRTARLSATRGRRLGLVAFVLGTLLAATAPTSASGAEGWKWLSRAEVEGEYDSNVFNLSSASSDRVDDQDPVNKANGRIRDMESVDDFILSPRIGVGAKIKNSLGSFSIVPSAGYHFHLQNRARDFPEIGFE